MQKKSQQSINEMWKFSQRGINEMRKVWWVSDPIIFKYANENIWRTKEKR